MTYFCKSEILRLSHYRNVDISEFRQSSKIINVIYYRISDFFYHWNFSTLFYVQICENISIRPTRQGYFNFTLPIVIKNKFWSFLKLCFLDDVSIMPGFHETAKGPYVKLSNGGQSAARLQEKFQIYLCIYLFKRKLLKDKKMKLSPNPN